MSKTLLTVILLLLSIYLPAQQVADTLFNPIIPNPAYSQGQGPVILIDEAHQNFHTANGRFKPFASFLERDGYTIKSLSQAFSPQTLAQGKILVIANSLHPDNQTQWKLPTPSAFTEEEITAVTEWVNNGGSLFLIADHMPFPGAAEKLAASFGIKFYNGFAMQKRNHGKDIFTNKNGLQSCALTLGRNESEKVSSLQSFTGQAFQIPTTAQAVVILNDEYQILMPQMAWEFTKETPVIPASNFVQGAYMPFGGGRIVVFGEAAMFTAQLAGGKNKVGMNASSAKQNAQFLLNAIHWLDAIIE
ncbi:DUF4350 domain-containing protein [Rhodocytophaga rosea]|uniref:DUF4350 domain-containing protein n=1 Tax=Rhodocytophaga rosea TaxID=2704465 RepID=A0A6C0GIA1_9BACT|nr:DUF4350 domain-containing protein [Rhodocytophaga rosea]QHT67689.1 DUF4350 domain-containing protein [Rhodocytophaga rosea]